MVAGETFIGWVLWGLFGIFSGFFRDFFMRGLIAQSVRALP